MHMNSGRAVVVAAISAVVRPGWSFLVPSTLGGHVYRNVRCKMMAGTAIPSRSKAYTAGRLDLETAERKAERLWRLGNAEKPSGVERPDMGLAQEVADRMPESQRPEHMDGGEDDAELSASRRYHYGGLEEGEDGNDDREYYI